MRKNVIEQLRQLPQPERSDLVNFSSNEAFVFECHPAFVAVGDGALCAWLQCRSGADVVAAKIAGDGTSPTALSSPVATAGPPQLCASECGVVCVWESCEAWQWSLRGKRLVDGEWRGLAMPASPNAQRFDPALALDADGHVWCAWVELDGRQRTLKLCDLDAPSSPVIDAPTNGSPCYRPRLTLAGNALWLSWEAYAAVGYRVCAWRVGGDVHTVSNGPGSDVLHTTGVDAAGRLWLAWVQSQDVEDADGVVDQWQSIEAAMCDRDGWAPLPRSADLCQGLLPKTAVWGYCGRRRHPILVADRDRMWALWERKDVHDNNTLKALGVLCGKAFGAGAWGAERRLRSGLLNYIVGEQAERGRARFVARDMLAEAAWDSGAPNVFEWVWGNWVMGEIELSDDAPELAIDEWTGWTPVALAGKRRSRPRFERDGLTLFWGDPHVHTAQSGDAEGEVDELLHYAEDKARLDFVAIADNDVYCFPLTDHEWARQQRFIAEHSRPGEFVVVPQYEWSWADPDSGAPNHRLVMFTKTGEPLWRHIDPGGCDIHALARSVERASGLLIGHHLGWVFADSAAEAAIEIVSAWSPHMVLKPEFIHDTLATGRRLAFTGGSDSHRRNPGFCGALTGVYATDLSAEALVEGIRRRRTVATTGSMIALDLCVGDALIGGDVRASGPLPVTLRAAAPRPIESLAVVRDGEVIHDVADVGATEAALEFEDAPVPGQHWYYARAKLYGEAPNLPSNCVVAQGHHAWTSPVWVRVG